MSDARDTNHDGHVSLMEKVKDKLHLGHKNKDAEYTATHHTTTTAHTTGARDLNHDGHISTTEKLASGSTALPLAGAAGARDLNRDGHISTAERLATGSHQSTGFSDSRDLNRDGHISTSERLASGSHHSTGLSDSRDLNRDGHISTAERLASGAHMGEHEEARLRLHEEQLAISKREVAAGEVDIHKRVQVEQVSQTIPVRHEEITVERHALHGVAEPGARIVAQDEVVRMPLYREEIITEKRLVPTEEVIVRKKEVIDQQTVGATLRSEYVETTQTGIAGAGFDARDTNRDGHVSMGEKLTGGHMATAAHGDIRDTNRDGHVSMGEKLKGADLNRDGHVSMGERIQSARG